MNPLDAAPVLPGETLAGKYRVERILGKGGMGIVVAARHLELDERVAIKFLIGDRAPVAVERFLREARAAAKVKSEHVCRVYDVGRLESGEPYMVLEHLLGNDLGVKLEQEERLSIEEAASYIIEVCAALGEAHALGIIHRDLKPANMFLAERADGSTCVKVLDFGISKVPSTSDMTSTAVMMGSPLYMSPEQIASSRSVDARSDIWSLGIVLFELVTGEPPFVADTMVQLSVLIREKEPRPLGDFLEDVPAGFAKIIERCLAKEQDDRYPSVKELALDLAAFARPEAAQLAHRIRAGAMRARAHSDPALLATARETPSERALRVATPPNKTPPSPEAAPSPPSSSEKPFGRATFDPLHTTTQQTSGRRPRWILAAFAIALLSALAFVVSRRGTQTPETPSLATTAVTPDVTAPVQPSERPPPDSASSEKPAETLPPVVAPPASASVLATPHAPPTKRVKPAPAVASSTAAVDPPPPPPPAATPTETAKPEPPPAPAGTRKKRTLDRGEVY